MPVLAALGSWRDWNPFASVRVGEAAHPGPPGLRDAGKMLITEGKKHIGLSFEDAYKDKEFKDKVLKRSRPASDTGLALQTYFKARDAKEKLGPLVTADAVKDARRERRAEASAGPPRAEDGLIAAAPAGQWQVVPAGAGAPVQPAGRRPRPSLDALRQHYLDCFWDLPWTAVDVLLAALLRVSRRSWCIFLVFVLIFPNTFDALAHLGANRLADLVVHLCDTVGNAVYNIGAVIFSTLAMRWVRFEAALGSRIAALFSSRQAVPVAETVSELPQNFT